MDAIFDRNGRPVGWLAGDVIYDRTLEPRAFVSRGAVFSYGRRFLGWFDAGYFRDARGAAVAFLRSASGSPLPPPTEQVPETRLARMAPVPPLAPLAPTPPTFTATWSARGWDEFVQLAAV